MAMTGADRIRFEAALVENEYLRKRVAELERRLARFDTRETDVEALGRSFKEREALLAEAERVAHMGSWVWDVPDNHVIWSEELFHILGYDPEKDVASTEAFFARIHPDDRERVQTASRRGIETGESAHVEFRAQLPDGSVRELAMDGALLFDAAGILRRAVGTVLDLTGARRAAEELRRAYLLLEETERLTQSASWEWQPSSNVVRWSAQMARLLDLPEDAEPSVALFEKHVHPEELLEFRRRRERAADGHIVPMFEVRVVRSGGEVRRVRVLSGAVRDETGALSSIYGSAIDITLQTELEERLRQSQKMEAIGQLAGGMAHDFNNLLTVMLGATERLKSGDDPARYVQDIETALNSAASLTHRLLAFSRRAVVAPTLVDLRTVLEDFRLIVTRTIGESITTSFEYTDAACVVRVDAQQAQQVLLNLIVNARDAMPRGGRLAVRVDKTDISAGSVPELEAGSYVLATVRDSGVGMSQNTLARIFEPFFTTKEVGKGTGLGLSMVYGAMKQSGGAVTVESQVDVGTTIRLYFKAVDEAVAAAPTPSSLPRKVASVLLVEDDPGVRRTLEAMFRRIGCEVFAPRSVAEAIQSFDSLRDRVQVLATDVVMPEMGGEALARILVEKAPELRVLFVTGYVEQDLALEHFKGRAKVLQKPFKTDQMERALAELLEPD
jgi:two-component system, cell cycle sensor histidine kinase and response regulator CckA